MRFHKLTSDSSKADVTIQLESRLTLASFSATCAPVLAALLLLVGCCVSLHAQTPDWENEQVIGINKLAPRATAVPFADRQNALSGDATRSPYVQSLNGPWRFHWAKAPSERPMEFYRDVTLWSADKLHIRDFFVHTELDAAYEDAVLKIDVEVANANNNTNEFSVEAELLDNLGNVLVRDTKKNSRRCR